MSDMEGTLNVGDVTSPADSSPASGNFDGYIETIPSDQPEATPAEAQNTVQAEVSEPEVKADEAQAVEDAPKETAKAEGVESDKPEPFHKHPRFQELIKRNKEYENSLNEMRQQMELLAKQSGQKDSQGNSLEDEFQVLQQKLEDGDISMAEALAKQRELIEAGAQQRIESYLTQQQRESEAKRLQDEFLKTNADFIELRDNGELEPIIATNPLHDNLSAYYAHKAQQAEAKAEAAVKEAVAKAVKETEARLQKEYTSKRNAASLGESAAHVPNARNTPPELQDTKRFGGVNQVLANRLRSMREARA
jgi:hypothetical protein